MANFQLKLIGKKQINVCKLFIIYHIDYIFIHFEALLNAKVLC